MKAEEILNFWFNELTPRDWFYKSSEVDEQIRTRFGALYPRAARSELFTWRATPEGRLAEIIVLDQFPRNIFRDSARAFESDPLALALAQEAVRSKADQNLPTSEHQAFMYMPYMHSESLEIHAVAVELFSQPGLEDHLKYEYLHQRIIQKFGRYPHRNHLLGRASTPEEVEFLKTPGSKF